MVASASVGLAQLILRIEGLLGVKFMAIDARLILGSIDILLVWTGL